jgi:hypothetical protein
MSEHKACPFCGRSSLGPNTSMHTSSVTSFIECRSCGARGPGVHRSVATNDMFRLWDVRENMIGEKIYQQFVEKLPDFIMPGGYTCEVRFINDKVTVLELPNLQFQIRLNSDGSWEVEGVG